MRLFKNLKLSLKLTLGFGGILIIFILTVMYANFGLNRISSDFFYYREISMADTIAGRVQANLLESRLAFKKFIQSGDRAQQKVFEERFSKMENFIDELKKNVKDSDEEKKINYISEYSKEYKDGFKKVLAYKDKRDDIYKSILVVKGVEMEKKLSQLMESAFKSADEKLEYGSGNALKNLLLARMYVYRFLENHNSQEKQKVEESLIEMDKWLRYCLESPEGSKFIQVINTLTSDKQIYAKGFDDIVLIIEESDKEIKKMDEIGPKISSLSEEIKLEITDEQDAMGPKVKKSSDEALIGMLVLSFLAFLFSVLIIIIIVRIVVIPVNTVTNTFKEVSEGDANLEVRLKANSTDELGEMAKYFNIFMNKLQTIMLFNKNQSWLKAGEAELSEKIQGEQDVKSLSANIITFVSKYVNAQIGAIYVKNEDNLYELIGSYAYKRHKDLSDKIKIGEGLVGQAALEKQSIVITNVPDDYIKITSGVGESLPRNILVTPCLFNNEVKCIIEFGSFNEFNNIQQEFIEEISESIAISIGSAESRMKMKELLNKTIEQSEELQVQQEELRQSNEELEEQARVLRQSETQMQSQQEELRVINEELQERTKILEIQKNDIFIKNENLENAQKEIEEKAKALEIASKYKSEFLANMSHELRTPLNSILVLSQMLGEKRDNTPLTDKQLEFAKIIHSSGEDLLKLINDILDLSKVEAGKMDVIFEDLYLDELGQYIERSFRPIAVQKGLNFTINIEKGTPRKIVSDTQRVQQIVNNLLSNAFKFTQHGEVTMTIGQAKIKDIKGVEMDSNGMVSIAVSDTGIGIPQDKQNAIFEAFKQCDGTTSRKYGGTGLGLSISKELAALLGGKIELISEQGKGSTFTLFLPENCNDMSGLSEAAAANEDMNEACFAHLNEDILPQSVLSNEIPDDREKISPKDKLLLIIEDDQNFSQILTDLAHEKGYKCIVAKNGESGLKLVTKYGPHAILLDIGLPDINGWKVIERLQMDSAAKNIPVHVISGSEIKKPSEELAGITGYLKKPVSLESLDTVFRKIEEVISKPFKKLMIIDENGQQTAEISKIIGNKGIKVISLDKGIDALNLLKKESFDCLILDLKLKDMSGFDLLEKLREENIIDLPVIIHTEKVLTQDDEIELRKYAESIIIKGSRSIDRLVAEASLFLHNVESKIEQSKINFIKSQQEKEDSLRNKKILIVDDDMRNVFALSSVLEEKGMKVVIGRNGKEGIQKLDQNQDVNLILMDIMMPEIDGYTAMREIRKEEKYRKIPIIALTAKAMKDDKRKCIESGASDYLTKPLDIDKLISLLRVWLYK